MRELGAKKPARSFRARTILVGDLDVKLKANELSEEDVWIEQVGDSLHIFVGAAARAARSGLRPLAAPSIERQIFAGPESGQSPVLSAPRVDVQDALLMSVGLPSLAATSPFGASLTEPVTTEDGRVVTNAAIAPQADPRRPGGWQDRSEAQVVAERYGGYTGEGPRPAGWQDPDLARPM
jgi:hypothetical protein